MDNIKETDEQLEAKAQNMSKILTVYADKEDSDSIIIKADNINGQTALTVLEHLIKVTLDCAKEEYKALAKAHIINEVISYGRTNKSDI